MTFSTCFVLCTISCKAPQGNEPEIDLDAYVEPQTTTVPTVTQSMPVVHAAAPPTSSAPFSQSLPVKPTPEPPASPVKPTTAAAPVIIENHYHTLHLGRKPSPITCPFCKNSIVTIVRNRPDGISWILCIVVFLFFWPLCWLPFVIPSCQSADHACPSCHRTISTTKGCE
jgi:lipopolysaccharide-induced tumor necrosis factor-alpha factor